MLLWANALYLSDNNDVLYCKQLKHFHTIKCSNCRHQLANKSKTADAKFYFTCLVVPIVPIWSFIYFNRYRKFPAYIRNREKSVEYSKSEFFRRKIHIFSIKHSDNYLYIQWMWQLYNKYKHFYILIQKRIYLKIKNVRFIKQLWLYDGCINTS